MADSSQKPQCLVCGSVDRPKRCSRCKNVFYCSIEHQKRDWSKHKISCVRSDSSGNSNGNITHGTVTAEERDLSVESADRNANLSQQAEIENILDFSTVKQPENSENKTSSENNKEMFHELVKSEIDDYTGPADNTDASGNNFDQTDDTNLATAATDANEGLDVSGNPDGNDFTPFDTRPFQERKFPKPESLKHKDLAKFIITRLIQFGYCVVDGFFEDKVVDGVMSEIKDLKDKGELKTGQLAGGRTSGDNSKKVTEMNIRSDIIKWITGQEEEHSFTAQTLAIMDSVTGCFNKHLGKHGFIQGRTKAMLACYPGNGTYYRKHVDNPSKDGRRITCALYLNKDWDVEKDGGLLRIFPPYADDPIDIPPLANRLLFFWSDRRNPHEVQPAFKDRFTMTVWYFDAEESAEAKADVLVQEAEQIHARIAEFEEQKRQMEEVTRNQQIQNKAMEAVMSLSDQELQALSFLINHHPNPRQVLTGMGISDAIHDALVTFLATQQRG